MLYFYTKVAFGLSVCELVFSDFFICANAPLRIPFPLRLSFDMDSHGHINVIYFDANDESDAHARQLKKKILGVLSNRLVISEQAESDNTRWGYRASETGEEGKLVYMCIKKLRK